MTKKLLSLVCLILSLGGVAFGQNATLSGKVSSNGEAVIGAAIQIGGTKLGTTTDANGAFRINNIPAGKVVVNVSSIGYLPKTESFTLKAGENKVMNIDMEEGSQFLEDVVVTGLAVNAKQKELGTSRSSLGEATLKSMPAPSVENALIGRMPGVEVYSADGAPGGGMRFRIRGGNSILGASEPLVIVDGIIMDNNNRNTTSGVNSPGGATSTGAASFGMNNGTRGLLAINPDEIESIEVLKGAAAASLYGSRASSGVIVVKTKSGGKGKVTLDYSLDVGSQSASRGIGSYKLDWSAAEIDTWYNLQKTRVGATFPFVDADLARWKGNIDQNWVMAGLQTGQFNRHNLRFTAGDKKLGVLAAVHTQNDDGHIKGTNFQVSGFRFSLNSEITPGLTVRGTVDYSDQFRRQLPGGSPGFFIPNAWSREHSITPLTPFMTLDDSKKISPVGGIANPDNYTLIRRESAVERIVMSGNINYKILSNLAIDINGGIDRSIMSSNTIYPFGIVSLFPTGRLDADKEELTQKTFNVGLNHAWQINEKTYIKSAVGTQYDENIRFYDYKRVQTRNTALPENEIASYTAPQVASYFQVNPIIKTFGVYINETVGINEKLFLNFGGRFDKGSSFINKFFFYPRASASYAITDKIRARAAYGVSGTQPPPYLITKLYVVAAGGYNGSGSSYNISNPANENLKPETQQETEFGIDANLLDGRLNVELTYYNKVFKDLLLNAPVSPNIYNGVTAALRNVGEMYNKGIEFGINYDLVKGENLTWNMGINGSTLENKVTRMTDPPVPIAGGEQSIAQIREGFPISGLFVGTLTSAIATRTYVGPTLPKLEASLNNAITYKGISFRAMLGGKWGHYRYNATSRYLADPTKRLNISNWSNSVESLTAEVNDLSNWVQKANFVKLRQLAVSYSFPKSVLESLHVNKLTMSLTGQNLITWTKYKGGYDVEAETAGSGGTASWVRGVDAWEAGLPKSWTFSLNIGL